MTNQDISQAATKYQFTTLYTDRDEVFIGVIDGPYEGKNDSVLEGYEMDYFYLTLIFTPNHQIIKLRSHDIVKIEEYEV